LIGVAVSKDQEIETKNDTDNETDMEEEEEVKIADPIEPFNRAMFVFNDRLYFWVLKPVAQKYSDIVPERARTGIDRFFENLKFPIRFVNNLLQANLSGAFSELGRFTVNTIWGIGGFLDPASKEGLELRRSDADSGFGGTGRRLFPVSGLLYFTNLCWPWSEGIQHGEQYLATDRRL